MLRTIDRQVLSKSEPVYDGDGDFRVVLPDDVDSRAASLADDEETFTTVLDAFSENIEQELRRIFAFDT